MVRQIAEELRLRIGQTVLGDNRVPHLRSGALKGLGVTSAARSSVLPELATFVEQGFKDTVVEGWAGIAAPAFVGKLDGQISTFPTSNIDNVLYIV